MVEKIKEAFKTFVASLIVMLGVTLLSFYVKNEFGIVSFLVGMLGFFILFPAIKKWETIIWGNDAKQK